jgi:hypothetical protein
MHVWLVFENTKHRGHSVYIVIDDVLHRGFHDDGIGDYKILQTKQTPWPLVRERTIPTKRPPLVDEM